MMKKMALFLFCGFTAFQAQANPSLCGYSDFFRISDDSRPDIAIVDANTTPELYMQVLSHLSFEIRDTPACRKGRANITVATNDGRSWCVLHLQDGPFMMHPKVHANCSGMRFVDMSYEGTGSFHYTIRLD
ncbi:hypothetical protein [Legionella quinlivanii]|nr:hypothetical protein [Legionella quinlivanii]